MSNIEIDANLFMTSVIQTLKSELTADGIIKTRAELNPQPSMIERMEKYLSGKYDFRNNPVLTRTEYKLKEEAAYLLLDERAMNSIFRELHLKGMKFSSNTLKSLLSSDFVENVDPFVSYFQNLPKWDGKVDYIEKLSSMVTTTNQSFWQTAFKKWIIAVVACAIYPEIVNHTVLVLSGKQGIGKTRWLESLLPTSLGGYLYNGTINPANKDALIQLSESLLINLDELENLNKSELGNLKSLITQGKIRTRRAYGVFSENYTRRASFMGSVNDSEFLTDCSGNRRYLSFTVQNISFEKNYSMDDVFAQAYHLLIHGDSGGKFKFWFDAAEIEQINENNEAYIRRYAEEELVLKYFEVPKTEKEATLMTPTDIIAYINDKEKGKIFLDPVSSAKRLGSSMQKHQFIKRSNGGQKPYAVKLI